jgi:DNA-binding SARP family transcriptional activator
MDAPYPSIYSDPTVETAYGILLLKQGLDHMQQGRDETAIALFELSCKYFRETHTQLVIALAAFIQDYTDYRHTQRTLQEASFHFAEAHARQKERTSMLSSMLPLLLQEVEATFDAAGSPIAARLISSSLAPSTAPFTATVEEPSPAPLTQHEPRNNGTLLPELVITCFGRFEVKRLGQPLALCSSRKGQGIMRYLTAQTRHSATIDTLMNIFWPEDEPNIALNKLHIAMSALRRSLNQGYPCEVGAGYIICKNFVYFFNPDVTINTDVAEFVRGFQAGKHTPQESIAMYERACQLYTGPFLAEDLYADWSFLQREQLSQEYLTMCHSLLAHNMHIEEHEHAVKWATAILKENRCDEVAHRQLLRMYALNGQRSEAIQQYQRCERALREELGIQPMPETTQLLQMVLANTVV